MKLASVFIFAFAFLAFTTSAQFVELTQNQRAINSPFLEKLRDFGVDYVIQKGTFESSESPLTGIYTRTTLEVEKIERRSTTAAAYYRYTVILGEKLNRARVRATFTIRFDHRNGAFLISSWRYTILKPTSTPMSGLTNYFPVDVRPFNDGTAGELDAFNARVQAVIAKNIGEGELPDSTYSVRFVYACTQEDGTGRKLMSVKVSNPEGEYYRLAFDYYSPPSTTPEGAFASVDENSAWIKG